MNLPKIGKLLADFAPITDLVAEKFCPGRFNLREVGYNNSDKRDFF